MKVLREEFYFEPRCINTNGSLKWYGETYYNDKFERHIEKTVYIRDNGKQLFVYSLVKDNSDIETEIKAIFKLICKINKNNEKWIYGRSNNE